MARLTRKELKKDPFLSVYYDDFVEFAEKHYQKIIIAVLIIAAVIAGGLSWKHYQQREEVRANSMLGEALTTFHAYVGEAGQGALAPGAQTFPDDAAKFQAALKEFDAVYAKYPHQKAGEIALYHIGLCQAQLGQRDAAVKTLRQAARGSDSEVASLARFALADELAGSGQLPEARKIFRDLAEHPTDTVPAATAWLALAAMERETQPSDARQIYDRLMKEYGNDAYLVDAVKQHLASMTQ
ncbi:MAG: tetratricopeptide repeat protein [Terriglobia bacterium]